MPNRLSHSACTKFKYCSKAWELYYIEKYRPKQVGSALLFGNAIGKSFELLLNTKNLKEAQILFDKNWEEQEINGVVTKLKTCKDILYSRYDMDKDLGDTPWETLKTKGYLMLTTFNDELLPKITKVYSTEEKVELQSGEDISIGFADAVVEFEGYDKPIVLDFKTASWRYEMGSVQKSEQLSQYLHSLGPKYNTRLAGYAVFLKSIKKNKTKVCPECGNIGTGTKFKTCNNTVKGIVSKNKQGVYDAYLGEVRCNTEWVETMDPKCELQVIIDEIPEEFELSVIDGVGEINDRINAGDIHCEYSKCNNNGWGRACEYRNFCLNNDSSDLIKLEKRIDNTKQL